MGCPCARQRQSRYKYVSDNVYSNGHQTQIISFLVNMFRTLLTWRQITVYRLNTYPFIHKGFLHAFFSTIALIPLMERFEAEHGTLLTGAMFVGRKSLHSVSERNRNSLFCVSSIHNTCRKLSTDRARNTKRERCHDGCEVNTA